MSVNMLCLTLGIYSCSLKWSEEISNKYMNLDSFSQRSISKCFKLLCPLASTFYIISKIQTNVIYIDRVG
jgi:hypothetical protein